VGGSETLAASRSILHDPISSRNNEPYLEHLGEKTSTNLLNGEAGLFMPALLPGRVGVSAVRNTEA
jgi:hypothetical protein